MPGCVPTAAGKTILLIEHNVEIVIRLGLGHRDVSGREDRGRQAQDIPTTLPSCTPISASRREAPVLNVDTLNAFYGKKQVLFGIDMALAERRTGGDRPERRGQIDRARAVFGLGPARRHDPLQRSRRQQGGARRTTSRPGSLSCRRAPAYSDLTVFENLRMGGYNDAASALLAGQIRKRSTRFRSCASAARRPPASCPAASGRCSPSAWR